MLKSLKNRSPVLYTTQYSLRNLFKCVVSVVAEVLSFLETRQLIVFTDGRYIIGPRHLHLSSESPQIHKHHSNWRGRALASLDVPKKNDLHYSVIWTLSKDDAEKIKLELTDNIQSLMKTVRDSKEEVAFGFTLDFFEQ